MKTFEVNIEKTKKGKPAGWEQSGETGSAHIWTGADGEKLRAYNIPRDGAPRQHALVPIEVGCWLINICPPPDSGRVNGSICKVTGLDMTNLKATVEVVATRFGGKWHGFNSYPHAIPEELLSAIVAATEKALCKDCRHAHYALHRKQTTTGGA
ncbi:MAG: hypothetical protein NTY30_01590 [Candidatus Berkelbacteria bacterium]|nr:hypothetical protein [Candidatus Berkelbacteria bacterium]